MICWPIKSIKSLVKRPTAKRRDALLSHPASSEICLAKSPAYSLSSVFLPQKQMAPADVDHARYTAPESIWAALSTGSVRLARMSWIIQHWKAGGILNRRQELPEEAFVTVQELQHQYGNGNRDGVLPIIAISFCWLTQSHPDPDGQQLALVASRLEHEKNNYAQACGAFKGFTEMGIFWDWLSLYQKNPALYDASMGSDGGERYRNSRTAEESVSFATALQTTMDLWYAHQGTTVFLLTQLPPNSVRTLEHKDSGWTTYERCAAEQVKRFFLTNAQWKLVVEVGQDIRADAPRQRGWPIGPDDFDELITSKKFTNGADAADVKALFRKLSISQLSGLREFALHTMPAPSMEEGFHLGRCLNLCNNLEHLGLASVNMSDDVCKVMFETLSTNALSNLQKLFLSGNQIGDEGCSALATACTSKGTAFARLARLDLDHNRISDDGVSHLATALALGALKGLEKLFLTGNKIGDAGCIAIAEACAKEPTALAQLRDLQIYQNQIGDAGIIALAGVCTATAALAKLEVLFLDDNQISDGGCSAIADVCSRGGLPELTHLTLGGNQIGDAGGLALATAPWGAMAQLKTLHLSGNRISEEALAIMTEALATRGNSVSC